MIFFNCSKRNQSQLFVAANFLFITPDLFKLYWYNLLLIFTTFILISVAAFSPKILRSASQTQLTWATSSRSTSASFRCKNPIYQSINQGLYVYHRKWKQFLRTNICQIVCLFVLMSTVTASEITFSTRMISEATEKSKYIFTFYTFV